MKRGLPFLCLLMLTLSFGALAEGNAFPAQTEDGTVLCGKTGEILCPAEKFSVIYALDAQKGLFCAQTEDTYLSCVVDENGNELCDAVYEDIYTHDGVLYARRDGLVGVLGEDYSEAIPCKYTEIVETGEGTFLAITTDPFDGKADGVYLVNENAQQSVTGTRVLFGLNDFSEGLMPALSADTACYGYLNTKGEWEIAAQYDYAGAFHKGFAEAALESGLGLIDRGGNWLLTPRYISLCSNIGESTLVAAQEDTESAVLIDAATMERIRTFTGESVWFTAGFDTDVVVFTVQGKTLLVGKSGDTLLEAAEDAYFSSSAEMGEYVIVHGDTENGYGAHLMTLSGEERTGLYRDMGFLTAWDGARYFLVTKFETEDAQSGEAWQDEVPDAVLYGVIDEFGNEVVPCDTWYVQPACDGALLLTTDTGCKLFDLSTKEYREIG